MAPRQIFGWSITLALAVLVLRVAGFIDSFTTGLGFIGLLAAVALLALSASTRRWTIPIFVGWAVLFILVPMGARSFFETRPMLKSEFEARGMEWELETAARMHPTALRARLGWHEYCNQVEDVQGAWMQRMLTERVPDPKSAVSGRRLPRSVVNDTALLAVMDTIARDREKCEEIVLGKSASPGGSLLARLTESNPLPTWGFLLLVSLVIIAACMAFGDWKRIVAVATVTLLAFIGWQAFYKGEKLTLPSVAITSAKAATPTIAIARIHGDTASYFLRGSETREVLVPGGGTLDAWYDPTRVKSQVVARGTHKARVYSLRPGVDTATVYVCKYVVAPTQADCLRS